MTTFKQHTKRSTNGPLTLPTPIAESELRLTLSQKIVTGKTQEVIKEVEITQTVATSDAEKTMVALVQQPKEVEAIAKDVSPKERFLLVDDNMINLKILSSFMQKMGQPHDTAMNGKEAVDAYQAAAGAYKCILMDISMPVMDGFEATSLIRRQERKTQMPASCIIALTGLASASAQQQAFESGIDLFLTKPVRFKELREILAARKLVGLVG